MTDHAPDTMRPTGFVPESKSDPCGHGRLVAPQSFVRPAGAYLQPFVDTLEVLDQGPTPSCNANAWADAIHRRMLMQGMVDADRPSRAFLYRGARANMVGKDALDGPLTGVRFSDLATACAELGYPAEKWDPWEPAALLANSDRDSTLSAYAHAWDQRGKATLHPIYVEDLEAHLAAGHALVTGFEIDGAFQVADMSSPWRLTEHTGDYHAVQPVGWDAQGNIVIRNSWGESWGNRGLALVTRDTIMHSLGVWAVEWTKSYSETLNQ